MPTFAPAVPGGVFGSIRAVLISDPTIGRLISNRVSPGRISSGWSSVNSAATLPITAPYVILEDLGGQFSHDVFHKGQRIDIYDTQLQVTVFANSYGEMFDLGRYVHGVMRQITYFSVEGIATYLMPSLRHELLLPKRSELGADIWSVVGRWRYWNPIGIQPISSLSTVNGKGFLALPGLLSSGSGAAS